MWRNIDHRKKKTCRRDNPVTYQDSSVGKRWLWFHPLKEKRQETCSCRFEDWSTFAKQWKSGEPGDLSRVCDYMDPPLIIPCVLFAGLFEVAIYFLSDRFFPGSSSYEWRNTKFRRSICKMILHSYSYDTPYKQHGTPHTPWMIQAVGCANLASEAEKGQGQQRDP